MNNTVFISYILKNFFPDSLQKNQISCKYLSVNETPFLLLLLIWCAMASKHVSIRFDIHVYLKPYIFMLLFFEFYRLLRRIKAYKSNVDTFVYLSKRGYHARQRMQQKQHRQLGKNAKYLEKTYTRLNVNVSHVI